LPSPWARANYSTPDCHRSTVQKSEFDCFSVTATSGEAIHSSPKTGVTFHVLDAVRLSRDFTGRDKMDQAGRRKKLLILMRCKLFRSPRMHSHCMSLSQSSFSFPTKLYPVHVPTLLKDSYLVPFPRMRIKCLQPNFINHIEI
jgi:hypothetical protein